MTGTATVTFRFYAAARDAAGRSQMQLAPGPTALVLAALATTLGARFAEVLAASSLLCAGHRLDPAATIELPAGAIVDVLPPFAGG